MNGLSRDTAEFVGRLSVAVWIGRLSDAAAREALRAYAATCRENREMQAANVQRAILAEYLHRRDGQDLCS